MAKEFARSGANLALVARNEADLASARAQIGEESDARVTCYSCDVSNAEDISPAILIMTTLHKVLDKSQARLYNTVGHS
jgi:short-subunit dehydrogenase